MRPTKALIDLKAVEHNLALIKQFAPKSKIVAVIKANAYGHGLIPVAKSIKSADKLAVACVDEALCLSKANIKQAILVLEGFFDPSELELAFDHGYDMVVHHKAQLDWLIAFAQTKPSVHPITIWLKLNTGMNRLGFDHDEYKLAYEQLKSCHLVSSVVLMSHLACADEISNAQTKNQIKLFNATCLSLKGERSMANSAGVIAWPETHFEFVRPGLAIFGCSPINHLTGSKHQLQAVMNLESALLTTRNLKKGESIGYGGNWVATEDCKIGVVAIGYGDGYPRHAKNGTPVWINGETYPVVGTVSMDMLCVNLDSVNSRSEPEIKTLPKTGDRVVLWGKELAVETIAEHADTIAYTLLCGVTQRVHFDWIS